MLYKMDLLCVDSDVFSVVNIRLGLDQYAIKKRHRKIKKRVESRFTVTCGEVTLHDEHQRLYEQHKSRFKGFIHATLDEYLHAGFHSTVFDTMQICVFDGDVLIAASYFDLGERSMASLIGMYDEGYADYSLGIYTMLKEIEFAFNICKFVKSNAIVLTNNFSTIGIGAGQPSRLDSCKIATQKAKKFQLKNIKKSIAASDAFFPFADGIKTLIDSGVKIIVQPGGSIRDKEVIDAANKAKIKMIFTGMRHFNH